jgi:O-antigen/teichoic acid export membrane protein
MSFFTLKFVFNGKITSSLKIDTKILLAYGIPTTLATLSLSSFITNDIILVKHYFNPEMAGLYAQLSLIGRIIFYISAPIAGVMFPLVVQQHAKKEKFTNTFLLAALFILLPSIAITCFYTLFPKFSILFIIKKQEALAAIPYLTLFSIYITLYSLVSIMASFYLSIKKTKVMVPIIIGAILQIILITIFHKTLLQIILSAFSITTILLIASIFYYPFAVKESK